MIKQFIGGNWKSNGDKQSINKLCKMINDIKHYNIDIVVFPSFIHIPYMVDNCNKIIGSQNCSSYESGAYTGEICASMLKDSGCEYVIIGHSERRQFFDNDIMIQNKIQQVLNNNLKLILCIGEKLEDKNNNNTLFILKNQLLPILNKFSVKLNDLNFIIAYEPVWAIGTGLSSTPDYAQNVHKEIRNILINYKLDNCRIIYGGSVKKNNSKELIKQNDINGFLIGGASLKDEFKEIIELI